MAAIGGTGQKPLNQYGTSLCNGGDVLQLDRGGGPVALCMYVTELFADTINFMLLESDCLPQSVHQDLLRGEAGSRFSPVDPCRNDRASPTVPRRVILLFIQGRRLKKKNLLLSP